MPGDRDHKAESKRLKAELVRQYEHASRVQVQITAARMKPSKRLGAKDPFSEYADDVILGRYTSRHFRVRFRVRQNAIVEDVSPVTPPSAGFLLAMLPPTLADDAAANLEDLFLYWEKSRGRRYALARFQVEALMLIARHRISRALGVIRKAASFLVALS